MKKFVSILVTIIMLLSVNCNLLASEIKSFDLINYLEENEVKSHDEFVQILSENCQNLPVSMYTYSLTYVSDFEEVDFKINIDYERNEVIVDTVYQEVSAATGSTSGSATKEVYSGVGALIYTLCVTGTFSRTSTSCSAISGRADFTPGTLSIWTSSPSVTTGNTTTRKAYVRMSGTATSLFQSREYKLTLYCDSSGTLTSSYSE